ncbi:hypothetical protein F2Q69_00017921 [Brassica cretica]|uniref:Uncharacterized protein n=1 Tax=Brassica cretica TaxID=69181 RepID=A0A8S9R3S6_BRACR|nr:hypothetical protein F2Q69_00017921 [Brassica cretica]
MPQRRGAKCTRTARVRADACEVVDEQGAAGNVQAEGVQPVAPQFDQAALMQMVQQAATQASQAAIQHVTQEAARVDAQEAARVAAQEVARQLAAGQQIPPQQIPPQQIPLQVPVQGVPGQQLPQGLQQPPRPPPLPVYRVYDERFYRLTKVEPSLTPEIVPPPPPRPEPRSTSSPPIPTEVSDRDVETSPDQEDQPESRPDPPSRTAFVPRRSARVTHAPPPPAVVHRRR